MARQPAARRPAPPPARRTPDRDRRDADGPVPAARWPQQPRPGRRNRPRRPRGAGLAGELWVPLSRAVGAEFQIDVEVGKQRVGRRRVRLAPPRRWTLYWIASSHTDVGLTALQEECLEVHRRNLDAALARLPAHPDFRWTAECALQLISYAVFCLKKKSK